jgi:hypothetical protein
MDDQQESMPETDIPDDILPDNFSKNIVHRK